MKVRIFAVSTETPDYKNWDTYNIAADNADQAVKTAKRDHFSKNIGERLRSVSLLASED